MAPVGPCRPRCAPGPLGTRGLLTVRANYVLHAVLREPRLQPLIRHGEAHLISMGSGNVPSHAIIPGRALYCLDGIVHKACLKGRGLSRWTKQCRGLWWHSDARIEVGWLCDGSLQMLLLYDSCDVKLRSTALQVPQRRNPPI